MHVIHISNRFHGACPVAKLLLGSAFGIMQLFPLFMILLSIMLI